MNLEKGFTVIELLVSISIIVIVSTLVLINFPKLNQQIFMNRAARDLAFTLRDAEFRSVAVNQAAPGVDIFPNNYGVYVSKVAGGNKAFFLFRDCDPDGPPDPMRPGSNAALPNKVFDLFGTCGDGGNELVQNYSFNKVHIRELTEPTGNTPHNELNITFYRPDPTLEITDRNSGPFPPAVPLSGIGPFKIYLQPDGYSGTCGSECKVINIWLTGQISIQ